MKNLRYLVYIALASLAASQAHARESTEIKCTKFVEKSGHNAPLELLIIVPPIGDPTVAVTTTKTGLDKVYVTEMDSIKIALDRSAIEVDFDTHTSKLSLKPSRQHGKHKIMVYKGTLQLFEDEMFDVACRVYF